MALNPKKETDQEAMTEEVKKASATGSGDLYHNPEKWIIIEQGQHVAPGRYAKFAKKPISPYLKLHRE